MYIVQYANQLGIIIQFKTSAIFNDLTLYFTVYKFSQAVNSIDHDRSANKHINSY